MIGGRFVCVKLSLPFLPPLAVYACQGRIRSLSEWQASCNSMFKSHHGIVRGKRRGGAQ